MAIENKPKIEILTVRIIRAFLSNHNLPIGDLPNLVTNIHRALSRAGATPAKIDPPRPAVPIRQSVKPDHIVCLEDGMGFEFLKPHLTAAHGMTPEQYRRKWDLPRRYPMSAPNYRPRWQKTSRAVGLGNYRSPRRRRV